MAKKKEKEIREPIFNSASLEIVLEHQGAPYFDEDGNPKECGDNWDYVAYFNNYIRERYHIPDYPDLIVRDGQIDLKRWITNFWNDKAHIERLDDFGASEEYIDFDYDMWDKQCVTINGFALYILCELIADIVKSRKVVRLEPSLEDTLKALSEVNEITFSNLDGSKFETRNPLTIKAVKDHLESLKDSPDYRTYGTRDLVDIQEVFTKEIVEAEFVQYLSRFMNQYFDVDRKGGTNSVVEQKFICFALNFFGLTPAKVGDARFRQLRSTKNTFRNSVKMWHDPESGNIYPLQVEFIKYEDWKNGPINILHTNLHPVTEDDLVYIGLGITQNSVNS